MWFWSVSWLTNCPVYFSLFFGRPKKYLFSFREFLVSLWFFWSTKFRFGIPKFLFSIPKNQSQAKKNSETDQKFPETEQFFFGRPKKMRNRPDNWSTKRLTKTTWTGLLSWQSETHFVWVVSKKVSLRLSRHTVRFQTSHHTSTFINHGFLVY